MRRAAPAFFGLLALALLSGCAAALLPLAAAGVLGKTELDRSKARKQVIVAGAVSVDAWAVPPEEAPVPTPSWAVVAAEPSKRNADGGGFTEGKEIAISAGQLDAPTRSYLARVYRAMRTSGNTPYLGFAEYALTQAERQKEAGAQGQSAQGQSAQLESAVLVPRVDIFKPQKVSCAGKPLAVMIDLDAPDMAAWSRADTLYRQDGLKEVLARLRGADITVIWLSDLPSSNAFEISSILQDAGLSGDGEEDDFLFLDRGGDDRKQARRWDAARSYCIVAAAGDKRSDFDELYDYLRNPDGAITLENMFGSGWFIAPPPLVVPPEDDYSVVDTALSQLKDDE